MTAPRARVPAAFLAIVASLAAMPMSSAAPPEVANLEFDLAGALVWDAAPGAAGYHLYRGPLGELAQGNHGGCLLGSIPIPPGGSGDDPPVGDGYFFLVSAFDETGEGILGISPGPGTPYLPRPACIPSRRALPFTRPPTPDGLPSGDGEPALNSVSELIWQGFVESANVLTHSGELVVEGIDQGTGAGLKAKGIITIKPSSTVRGRVRTSHGAVCEPGHGGGLGQGTGRAEELMPAYPPNPCAATLDWHYEEDDEDMAGRRARGIITKKPVGGGNARARGIITKKPGGTASGRGMTAGTTEVAIAGGRRQRQWSPEQYIGMWEKEQGRSRKGSGTQSNPLYEEEAVQSNPLYVGRVYRSGILYDGPLGHGWDFPANARLAAQGPGVVWYDGLGARFLFSAMGGGAYLSPRGVFSVLLVNADGALTLRHPDGTLDTFHALDGSNLSGALLSRSDDAGGLVNLLYDAQGLLTTIVDDLGRATSLAYDAAGRIVAVTDFMGRATRYEYDAHGRLVASVTPEVTGTPNGNDFPAGKRTEYTYSDWASDTSIRQNLTAITSPNEAAGGGPPRVQFTYGGDPASFDYDRVVAATIGAPPAVGGTMSFGYAPLNPAADPSDPTFARRHTVVLDENGNQREYLHNAGGHLLGLLERTNRGLRPLEPDYVTSFSHDPEGRLTGLTSPSGTRYEFTWDALGADRYRRGNLLELRVVADALASGGRGDGHGGDLADIVWSYTYEPLRNGLASATDPLGRVTTWQYDYQEGDPATSGVLQRAALYGIDLGGVALGSGDLNSDGRLDQILGLPVRIQEPTVTLEPGSRQALAEGDTAQERVWLRIHDDYGQPVCQVDPVGSHDCFSYHPQTDPDGDGIPTPAPPDGRTLDPLSGGYLANAQWGIDSVGGATAETAYRYRTDGALAWARNGRGVSTVFTHNELGQLVEVREAASTSDSGGPHGDPPTGFGEPGLAPVGARTWFHYDANDNLVRVAREDLGETRGVGPTVDTVYVVDLLGQVTSLQEEVAPGMDATTTFQYDAAGNLTRASSPAGRAHEFAWDERSLLLSSTRGAAGPFGGDPSTRQYEYDGGGRLTRRIDGRGGIADYDYDGLDRLVRVRDPIGGTSEWFYNAHSQVTRTLARGHDGGPTPPDPSGASNVDLREALIEYDEASRPRRLSRPLVMPRGAAMMRPPVVQEGPLVPGDGAINRLYEYDAAGRPTFATDDMGSTTEFAYDAFDRMTTATLADGSSQAFAWDAAGNRTRIDDNEHPAIALVQPARYLTSWFYDALDRPVMTVDNAGAAYRFAWNASQDLGAVSDARGPMTGESIVRDGSLVPINSHGNVTRYTYDGLGRMLRSEQVLTASGNGDGTLTPAPAPTTYNPDGLRSVQMVWGADDLIEAALDDAGNETLYEYDNLGRLVREQADDGTASLHLYDSEDNPVTTVNANGSVIARTFDSAGREVLVNINPNAPDEGTTLRAFTYDGLDRVTRAFDNNQPGSTQDDATVEFFYDSLDRVLEEQQSLSDGSPTAPVDSHWLGGARRTLVQGPTPGGASFSHDALDRVTSVLDIASGMSATYEYLGPDRLGRRTFGNGVVTTTLDNTGRVPIGYDAAGRLIQMRHLSGSAPGATLLAGFQYRYDPEGNPLFERRAHQPAVLGSFLGERTVRDSAGRMTSFAEGPIDAAGNLVGPPTDTWTWSLDGNDNWAQFTRDGVAFLNTPNNLNEYDEPQSGGLRIDDGVQDDFGDAMLTPLPDGTNQGHDRRGNQVTDGGITYRYDADGRLIWARRGSAGQPFVEYAYDAFGRRVRALRRSGTVQVVERTVHDGPRPIVDYRDGALAARGIHGSTGKPIMHFDGTGAGIYLLENGRGSIVAAVPDGSVAVAGRVTYDPYGKPTFEDAAGVPLVDANGDPVAESPFGNREGFLGRRYDSDAGERHADKVADRGGLYCDLGICYDPDQGRDLTLRLIYTPPATGQIRSESGVPASAGRLMRGRDLKHFSSHRLPTTCGNAREHVFQHNQTDLEFVTRRGVVTGTNKPENKGSRFSKELNFDTIGQQEFGVRVRVNQTVYVRATFIRE